MSVKHVKTPQLKPKRQQLCFLEASRGSNSETKVNETAESINGKDNCLKANQWEELLKGRLLVCYCARHAPRQDFACQSYGKQALEPRGLENSVAKQFRQHAVPIEQVIKLLKNTEQSESESFANK